jgi:hypothetical protein
MDKPSPATLPSQGPFMCAPTASRTAALFGFGGVTSSGATMPAPEAACPKASSTVSMMPAAFPPRTAPVRPDQRTAHANPLALQLEQGDGVEVEPDLGKKMDEGHGEWRLTHWTQLTAPEAAPEAAPDAAPDAAPERQAH